MIHESSRLHLLRCRRSENMFSRVINCEIMVDDIPNTSDHLPICTAINVHMLPKLKYVATIQNVRYAWHKLNVEDIHSSPWAHIGLHAPRSSPHDPP